MSWIDSALMPLKIVVAWIMVRFHDLFVFLGLPEESGLSWALAIVGLVIVMRIILIPLFVKQIKASRGMQLLAPDMQKIQKKYKGKTDPASREAMSRETMELYRKHGTNPFASCLPILAQSPIFFALFRVLYNMPRLAMDPEEADAYPRDSIGPLTRDLAQQFTDSTLFGARLSDWFLASDEVSVKVVAAVLIVAMSATTFFTQKQLTQKNMPATALQGPMAQQQKMLLYLLPLIFLITGVNFPIGVLIYWTTTNIWSMGQQFYVIRRNPTPGSEAERLLKERRAKKAAAKGIVLEEEKPQVEEKPRGQRQQPKRKHRAKGTAVSPTRPDDADAQDADSESGEADAEKPSEGPSTSRPGGGKGKAGTSSGERKAGTSSGQRKAGTSSSQRKAGAGGGQRKPGAAGGQRKPGATGGPQRKPAGGGSAGRPAGGGPASNPQGRPKKKKPRPESDGTP